MLETWEDKFIPFYIMDNIVYCNSDQHKCERYVTNLYDVNYENNLDAARVSFGIEEDYINTGCVYSNIDDGR